MPTGLLRRGLQTPKVYVLGGLAPFVSPEIRFALVCPPRSGSDLLVSLLDSHPLITCHSEILGLRPRRLAPEAFVASRAAGARLRGARAYGFKLIVVRGDEPGASERSGIAGDDGYDAKSDVNSAQLADELDARDWRLIGLRRRSILAVALSRVRGERDGRWHVYEGDDARFQRFHVDPDDLLDKLESSDAAATKARQLVQGRAELDLVYEDDLSTRDAQQATVDRICDRFGLPHAPVSTDIVRMAPAHPADRIANLDEVEAALRGTRWEPELSPSSDG